MHFSDVTSLCQCFADLHPFHCEEEEGVDLVQIQCIDHLKVPNKRPILRMLSRHHEPQTTEKITSKRKYELGLSSTTKGTTLAAASIVLILSALALLLCLIGKTYHENNVRKKAEIAESISRKSSQVSTDTLITRLWCLYWRWVHNSVDLSPHRKVGLNGLRGLWPEKIQRILLYILILSWNRFKKWFLIDKNNIFSY